MRSTTGLVIDTRIEQIVWGQNSNRYVLDVTNLFTYPYILEGWLQMGKKTLQEKEGGGGGFNPFFLSSKTWKLY